MERKKLFETFKAFEALASSLPEWEGAFREAVKNKVLTFFGDERVSEEVSKTIEEIVNRLSLTYRYNPNRTVVATVTFGNVRIIEILDVGRITFSEPVETKDRRFFKAKWSPQEEAKDILSEKIISRLPEIYLEYLRMGAHLS